MQLVKHTKRLETHSLLFVMTEIPWLNRLSLQEIIKKAEVKPWLTL